MHGVTRKTWWRWGWWVAVATPTSSGTTRVARRRRGSVDTAVTLVAAVQKPTRDVVAVVERHADSSTRAVRVCVTRARHQVRALDRAVRGDLPAAAPRAAPRAARLAALLRLRARRDGQRLRLHLRLAVRRCAPAAASPLPPRAARRALRAALRGVAVAGASSRPVVPCGATTHRMGAEETARSAPLTHL